MKSTLLALTLTGIGILGLATTLFAADPPSVINHQGRITVSGVNFDGTGFFKFAFVDTGAATTYWNNDLSQGAMTEPADGNAVQVTVAGGHYGVGLGDTGIANMGALDPDIFADNSDVNLRIWFSQTGAAASFEQLTPDIKINSVGFALNARKAQMVPNGAIGTAALADGSVTEGKIATTFAQESAVPGVSLSGVNSSGGYTLNATFGSPFTSIPVIKVDGGEDSSFVLSAVSETGFTAEISNLGFDGEIVDGATSSMDSAEIVNGNPAIAYYEGISDEIRYAYSSDPGGAPGTWTVVTVATGVQLSTSFLNRGVSLAVVDGKPAIAYHEIDDVTPANSQLRYASSSDVNGIAGSWTATAVVDSSTNLRTGPDFPISVSLAEVSGKPALTYTDFNGVDTASFSYLYSSDAQGGTGTWTTVVLATTATVDGGGSGLNPSPTGRYHSLAVVNGNPAASFNTEQSMGNLRFAYATDPQGLAANWNIVDVNVSSGAGFYNSLAVVNGKPAIAHVDVIADEIRFSSSSDPQGLEGTWTTQTLASTGTSDFSFVSLAVVDGLPAVAYVDDVIDRLEFQHSSDADGVPGTWSQITVDAVTFAGRYASLVNLNGAPGIAYRSGTGADLLFGTVSIDWAAFGGDVFNIQTAMAASVGPGMVTSQSLANGAVTAGKLGVDAVTTPNLATGAVTAVKVSPDYSYLDEFLTGDSLFLNNLSFGSATIDVTFDTPFNSPPTLTLPASGSIISGLTVTETGFTADVFGLGFIGNAVELSGNEGNNISSAMVNGRPAVVYNDADSGELKYARSSSAKGEAGTWTIVTVDVGINPSSGFRAFSLAVIDGIPAVAYHDIDSVTPSNSALWYARASEPTGVAGFWTPNVIDSSTNLDSGDGYDVTLIEEGSNRPAVLYLEFNSAGSPSAIAFLRFRRGGNASGTSWSSAATITSSAPIDLTGSFPVPAPDGRWSSMAMVNGAPAASYSVTAGSELHYAYSTDANGLPTSTWTTGIVADTTGLVGQWNSLAVVNGKPAIAHKDASNDDVVFTYSSSPFGQAGTWTTVLAADLPGPSGTFGVSLATVGGKPAIGIYDGDTDDVLYAYSTDVQGLGGTWKSLNAATSNDSGRYVSLVDAAGCPLISYREFDGVSDSNPMVATLDLPAGWIADGGETLPVQVNRAQMATMVVGGAIDSAALAVGAVGTSALAVDAVTTDAILDGTISISDIAFDHGEMGGLGDDDHPQYVLADGTRAFTGAVSGVAPTVSGHLATKGYVDSAAVVDHGLLSGLGDDDHPQYLRSNASDSYTSGTMGFSPGTSLIVNGTFAIGSDNTGDDDQIGFDGNTELLRWDDSETAFLFTDGLTLSGPLNAGDVSTPVTVAYNYFSSAVPGPSSGQVTNGADLYVGDDIELNGDLYADGDIRIGTDSSTDDDTIYFDTGSAQSLNWDDSDGRFEFSTTLAIDGRIHAGVGADAFVTAGYNFIANTAPSPASGDITNSIDLFIAGDLEVGQTIYGTVSPPSDRNIKEGFEPIEIAEVLEKVAALPITTWQYKDRGEENEVAVRHMGPVAQDFMAAFSLGGSDRHIATIDADGVALAAIQALKAESDAKSVRIAELEARLARLEKALEPATDKGE